MKIRVTGKRQAEVLLDSEELTAYGLTYAQIEPGNRKLTWMMGEIISRVYEETGMDFLSHTLFLSASKAEDGCILVLSGLSRNQKAKRRSSLSPSAFDFQTISALFEGSERLLKEGISCPKSSLYRMKSSWRLLLSLSDGQKLKDLLKPFGRYAGCGILFEASAVEYGRPVFKKDALSEIQKAIKTGNLPPYPRSEEIASAGSDAPNT